MEEEITIKYKIFTIIAGILTLIPILNIVYNFVNITSEWIYIASFYATKIIGIIIYIFILKEMKKRRIIYIALSAFFLLTSILFYIDLSNVSGGLDSVGQALGVALFTKFSLYAYYVIAFILYISYAKKFIFKKNAIIRAAIALLLVAAIWIGSYYLRTERASESKMPTVKDFENELVSRDICNIKCSTSSNTKLYGIKRGLDKADELNFDTDSNKKYPLYAYATTEKQGENNWIMYYINGNLYAVHGKYYVSSTFNEERKVLIDYPNIIVSESEDIVTYNIKTNSYEVSKSIIEGALLYYGKDDEISVFVDYPVAESKYNFFDIKVVDRIDKYTLSNIKY